MSGFKVMWGHDRKEIRELERLGCPKEIPWSYFPQGAREQAEKNHDQTLERLNERGGLHPRELLCVVEYEPLYGEKGFWNEAMKLPLSTVVHRLKSWMRCQTPCKCGHTNGDHYCLKGWPACSECTECKEFEEAT